MVSNMKIRILTRAVLLLLIFFVNINFAIAQQKRTPPAKSPQKAPQPAPTFDTLLASDSYKIYGEIRGVGQLIRSSSVNDLLEPVMKLAAPPREFKTLVKWLNTHADAVMTSRMLVAAWPTGKNVPDMLIAIEFSSPEEAAKFEPQLNEILPKVVPAAMPESSPSPSEKKNEPAAEKLKDEKPNDTPPPKPNYYIKRAGALLFITSTPLNLKNLRPAGSKLLAEDAGFRIIHDRFNSESVFLYVDVKGIEKQEEERSRQYEEDMKRQAAVAKETNEQKAASAGRERDNTPAASTPEEPLAPDPSNSESPASPPQQIGIESLERPAASREPDPVMTALSTLSGAFFSGETKWPEAVGLAIVFEDDSLDIRALLVNAPNVKDLAVPFIPQLISGPAITPESPSILPADTELFVSMSLDLPQVYQEMIRPHPVVSGPKGLTHAVKEIEVESPFAPLEKKLGIKIKDDLLPVLGNEMVLSMPVKALEPSPPTRVVTPVSGSEKESTDAATPPATPSPLIAVSLKDKEAMRVLLPKIIDGLGFKGASALAQTEKREDTELVSYANVIAYAFIGNFLVLSPDVASIRHLVDSYLKHETLASDTHYKNYTRWQPRQQQGQVYVSPALMESYKAWANEPSWLISDQTRDFLMRLSIVSEPITYSLSNDGLGPLHELHVPKNLVLMAVAGMSGEAKQSPLVNNERMTRATISWIATVEAQFHSGKGAGAYATLDQLVAEKVIPKEMLDQVEKDGYKIEVTVTGNHFEIMAVPLEYGKTGKLSFFVDESNVVRGGDHGGAPATISDKPVP